MKISVVVDSTDLYCITTICPVVIFANDAYGNCPSCHQPGEAIPGSIEEGIDV